MEYFFERLPLDVFDFPGAAGKIHSTLKKRRVAVVAEK